MSDTLQTSQNEGTGEPALRREVLRLLKEQQHEPALEVINTAPPEFVETPAWRVMQARALLIANNIAGTRQALAGITGEDADAPNVLQLRLAVAKARGDHNEAISCLRQLHEAKPDELWFLISLAQNLLRHEDAAEAEMFARKAIDLDPASAKAHRILYFALCKTARAESVADAIRAAIASPAAYPHYTGLRMSLLALEPSEAEKLIAEITARWPEAAADLTVAPFQFRPVVDLILADDRPAAFALLEKMGDAETDPRVRDALGVISAFPDPKDFKRALIADTGEEVVTSAPSSNGVTVLFFTGLGDRVDLDLDAMDAFCAASGAAAVYLRDFTRMAFLGGIRSLGHGRSATVKALRQKLADLGTRELVVIGVSAGTFSSVTYGVELGASRIAGLGAQTSIHHFLKAGGDPRARLMIERIKDQFDPAMLDLKILWGGLSKPPRLDLYFGELHANDAAHANHMAGLENVFLHPLAGLKQHNLIIPLMKTGALRDYVQSSVSG